MAKHRALVRPAARVDCGDIPSFDLHLIHGFEGFLVIESTQSLDVVVV